jgi:hypothetical protein
MDMRKHRLGFALALGMLVTVFTACSFNFTTANMRSVKISKDEDGKHHTRVSEDGVSSRLCLP